MTNNPDVVDGRSVAELFWLETTEKARLAKLIDAALADREGLREQVERLAEAATKVAASANVADWTNPSELVVHEPYVAELCQAIADYRKFTEGS